MANLPAPYSRSSLGLSRVERRAATEIALTRAASTVLAARESAKIEALTEVAETALLSAAELSILEGLLVARNPGAFAGRAAYINDRACMAIGGVVTKMTRSL
jgi:hypothetical protein